MVLESAANTKSSEMALKFEPSPLYHIPDYTMIGLIACRGFCDQFDIASISFQGDYDRRRHPETWAYQEMRLGKIESLTDRSAALVILTRDPDNRGIRVHDLETNQTVIFLNLRDRQHDGTNLSTSPRFLQKIGGVPPDMIPSRSSELGGTNWYYASPEYDTQRPNRRSVEMSRVVSDPKKFLIDKLGRKTSKLFVDAGDLTDFIKDPFKSLPLEDPNDLTIANWYKMWWQVANRGLRGKSIPYPGQTAEAGFRDFSAHAISALCDHSYSLPNKQSLLAELGYTHLSSVPSWYHVWALNLTRGGFLPDNERMHQQATSFFQTLDRIPLPEDFKLHLGGRTLGDLEGKIALKSWFAIVPYALALRPDIEFPELCIPEKFQEYFNIVFNLMKETLIQDDGTILTYPLFPGRNLWLSREVK